MRLPWHRQPHAAHNDELKYCAPHHHTARPMRAPWIHRRIFMATNSADSNHLEKELVGLEKEYWQAIRDKDAKTASKYSDDPCIVVGAQGVGSIKPNDYSAMM